MLFIAVVWFGMVYMNERYKLFSSDHFSTDVMKWIAYFFLGVFLLMLTFLIVGSSLHPPTSKDLAKVPFYSLFTLHIILFVFLLGWWLLTRRPPIGEYLNMSRRGFGEAVMTGFAVGVGGWIVTILLALAVALLLSAAGLIPKDAQPSPMIGWMASLPLWKKGTIVFGNDDRGGVLSRLAAEARRTDFLHTALRAGAPDSPAAAADRRRDHLAGHRRHVYRTKNLQPGIIAHGIFDAVQLFVLIPIAFKMTEPADERAPRRSLVRALLVVITLFLFADVPFSAKSLVPRSVPLPLPDEADVRETTRAASFHGGIRGGAAGSR
jgi:hypothetical protein